MADDLVDPVVQANIFLAADEVGGGKSDTVMRVIAKHLTDRAVPNAKPRTSNTCCTVQIA